MHRIRSGAREHATSYTYPQRTQASPLPRYNSTVNAPSISRPDATANVASLSTANKDGTGPSVDTSKSNHKTTEKPASSPPPAAPPPDGSASVDIEKQHAGSESAAIEATTEKPSWPSRAWAGSKRFVTHTKDALTHSWINVLLVFVPVGIAVNYAPIPEHAKPTVVFAMNAVAIIPLAGLLAHATEAVAAQLGDTLASLLNVTFGNAVELIIFIIALAKNQIRIVQASILGSILANLLLILGMAFLFGGLRFREQLYNNTVTQMSACLLSLSVTSLILPTAFHASFNDTNEADRATIKISRGSSVILLLVYMLYLAFQLKSHAYMYESTPQNVIDEESHPGLLADLMNSSSSDDSSSSSSDSDSDGSSGSHVTAKKRIKRAFKNRRRRKSSASSTVAASVPSTISSPVNEARSTLDSPANSSNALASIASASRQHAITDDEADDEIEGDTQHAGTRVRDFGGDKPRKTSSPPKSSLKKQKKLHGKNKQHHHHQQLQSAAGKNGQAGSSSDSKREPETNGNILTAPEDRLRVGFAEPEPVSEASNSSPKRPFAKRQFSSFRPPLTSLLSNTVFSTPPPPATGFGQSGLSVAHRASPRFQVRRTSSLPEMKMGVRGRSYPAGPEGPTRFTAQGAAQGDVGPPAINEVSAGERDQLEDDEVPQMSRTAAIVLLLCTTGLVAFCAELLVDAIPEMVADTSVSEAFIGLIILPIVGNAAEHVTAVTVAIKNKMDLAIGVAVGSSIQIALFVTPFVVILGWIMDKDMSLYFNLFETVSLFVTTLIVNFLILDGRSNYLEGSLLIAGYIIIALSSFFYPSSADQSELGGSKELVEAAVSGAMRLLRG